MKTERDPFVIVESQVDGYYVPMYFDEEAGYYDGWKTQEIRQVGTRQIIVECDMCFLKFDEAVDFIREKENGKYDYDKLFFLNGNPFNEEDPHSNWKEILDSKE